MTKPTEPAEPDFQEIIKYLNLKTGKKFRITNPHRGLIRARFKEGYELADFKQAIDNQVRQWTGTDKEQYLRPQTIFNGKFDGYVNNIITVGLAQGEVKEKPVVHKPDPLANNPEFDAAMEEFRKHFGKQDPGSKAKLKAAQAKMEKLSKQVGVNDVSTLSPS